MVPTPPLPGSEHSPDAADGIKELDAEWVKLHAQRVTNTLPGGLCVPGVYVFCPKDVDTQGPLRRLVFKVAEPSDVDVAEVDTDGVPGKKERIALHICSKSRKCGTLLPAVPARAACRHPAGGATFAAPAPPRSPSCARASEPCARMRACCAPWLWQDHVPELRGERPQVVGPPL